MDNPHSTTLVVDDDFCQFPSVSQTLHVADMFILQFPKKASGIHLPSSKQTRPGSTTSPPRLPLLPALTTYRAHMMLMTALDIHAADLPVFPRSLVKCGSLVYLQGATKSDIP